MHRSNRDPSLAGGPLRGVGATEPNVRDHVRRRNVQIGSEHSVARTTVPATAAQHGIANRGAPKIPTSTSGPYCRTTRASKQFGGGERRVVPVPPSGAVWPGSGAALHIRPLPYVASHVPDDVAVTEDKGAHLRHASGAG